MKKSLVSLLFAGIAGLSALVDWDAKTEAKTVYQQNYAVKFDSFGKVSINEWPIVNVRMADVDGDGDLDMIVATKNGNIYVIENKMPRKRYH